MDSNQKPTSEPQPSQNRRERRAASKAGRSVVAREVVVAEVQKLRQKIEAVLGHVESIRTAVNKNFLGFRQVLSAVDGHISVMRAVIDDLGKSLPPDAPLKRTEDGGIDWHGYVDEYNAKVAEENRAMKTENADPTGTTGEDDVEVFGGD